MLHFVLPQKKFRIDFKNERQWIKNESLLHINDFDKEETKRKVDSCQKSLSVELDGELYGFFQNEIENYIIFQWDLTSKDFKTSPILWVYFHIFSRNVIKSGIASGWLKIGNLNAAFYNYTA